MISFTKDVESDKKELMEIIHSNFKGEQLNNIKLLFEHFDDRINNAPASGRPNYHNCFRGGWINHTLRVVKTSLKMKTHFEELGVKVKHSDSDVVLAAMFHDLGKLGDLDSPYYLAQTDEWRRNKLNEWYTYNDKIENMSVTDRALWLLQHFNIQVSTEVWKAIKMSDGMFDAGNEGYYRTSTDSTNILHYIVHFADWMSTVSEKQHYIQSLNCDEDEDVEVSNENKKTKKEDLKNIKNEFDKLFGN